MKIDASLREQWFQVDDGWRMTLPEGWMQGRSVYGGLTAAVTVALGARQVDASRRLRTMNVQLLRPVAPTETHGVARVLREGKGTAFVEVRLSQAGEEIAVAQLTFVRPREGSLALPSPERPTIDGPDGLIDLPHIPNVTPEFVQHAHMRWADGRAPFTGTTERYFDGWCGFRVPAGDAEGLIALLDVWPSPTLSMMKKPTFASTVTWTAHVLDIPASLDELLQFRYRAVAAQDGFHTVAGHLWGPDGRLLAWTEQLVALYD